MVYLNGNRLSSSKKNMEYIWYCLPKGGLFCDVVVIIQHFVLKSPTWNETIGQSAVARRKANWTSLVASKFKSNAKKNMKKWVWHLPASVRWHERICSTWSSSWNHFRCSSFRMDRPISCWPWWKPSSCSCTWIINRWNDVLVVFPYEITCHCTETKNKNSHQRNHVGSFERRINVHAMYHRLCSKTIMRILQFDVRPSQQGLTQLIDFALS